jgi:hypothetical protein
MTDRWTFGLGFLATGLGFLGYVVLCLSGRRRRWAHEAAGPHMVMGVLPAFGLFLIFIGVAVIFGIDGDAVFASAPVLLVCGLVGVILSGLRPSWWGPRWYRTRRADLPDGHLARTTLSERSLQHQGLAFKAWGKAVPLQQWSMKYVLDPVHDTGIEGKLQAFPEGLLFVGDVPGKPTGSEDPACLIPMAKATIRGLKLIYEFQLADSRDGAQPIRRETPMLLIDMEGGGQAFSSSFVTSTARKVSAFLGVPLQAMR